MKVKYSKFYLTEIFSEGSIYEKFLRKNKEYIVLAIRFISGTRAEVLVLSDYLYRPIWAPIQGMEITDDFIPNNWIYIPINIEDGIGIYYYSNNYDISVTHSNYTALYRDYYAVLAEEIKDIQKLSMEHNKKWPRTLENEMTILMDEWNLKKFTPDVYCKIKAGNLAIYELAKDIEDYIIKYHLPERWLYFIKNIKKACRKQSNEFKLAETVLKNLSQPYALDEIHVSSNKIPDEKHRFQINNELSLLICKLQYCCDYLIAKNDYLDVFDDINMS